MTRRYRATLDGMALGMIGAAVIVPANETWLAAFFLALLAVQARMGQPQIIPNTRDDV